MILIPMNGNEVRNMTGNTVYVLLKGEVDTLNQKIDDAIVGVFTNGGSVAFENLPALSLDKVG